MSKQEYAKQSDVTAINSPTNLSTTETTTDKDIKNIPLVFISYSHVDEVWKDRLYPHLSALQHIGKITVWNDRDIGSGEAWNENIQQAMEQAQVAICLISPDFLASSFCVQEEIPKLLERHDNGELKIIPVLLRPCGWNDYPWLARLQMLPRDGKTVATDFREDYDSVFKQVAKRVSGSTYLDAENDKLAPRRKRLLDWLRTNPALAGTGFLITLAVMVVLARGLTPAPLPDYIHDLMETAAAHIEMGRTCQPAGSSAWDAYQTILHTHPEYRPAIRAQEKLNCTGRS